MRVLATVKDRRGRTGRLAAKRRFHDPRQRRAAADRGLRTPDRAAALGRAADRYQRLDRQGPEVRDRFRHAVSARAVRARAIPRTRWRSTASTAQVTARIDFTRNCASLERSLKHAARRGRHFALRRHLSRRRATWRTREGRKVIVVVTDGGDTTSSTDFHAGARSGATGRRRDLSRSWWCPSPTMPGATSAARMR